MNQKHIFYLLTLISFTFAPVLTWSQVINNPAPSLQLKMESSNGTNGAAVAYNPQKGYYYAVIAGNAQYPLETFDKTGKNLHSSKAWNDMRGLWWNPKAKALEGNCYNDGGIVHILLDENGYAGAGNKTLFKGTDHQPNVQSLGAFDGKKTIYYYYGGRLFAFSRKDGNDTGKDIALSIPVGTNNISAHCVIYTGHKKMEIGVLDYVNRKVYLFNKKTGKLAATINLPSSATVHNNFRFSYSNDYVFLYDANERVWTGYKIFE